MAGYGVNFILKEKSFSSESGTLCNSIIVCVCMYVCMYIYNILCSDLNTRMLHMTYLRFFIYMLHAIDNILMSYYQQTAQQIILTYVWETNTTCFGYCI